MDHIGKKIQEIRMKIGYSRQYVSKNICDESTLYRIEKSLQLPRLDVLQKICHKLNISVDFILTPDLESQFVHMDKIKKLCRESLYQQDFDSIQYLIEEAETFISKHPNLEDEEFLRFVNWQKAILIHKIEKKADRAETAFRKLLYKNKIIREIDINIANSLALVLIEKKEFHEAGSLLRKSLKAAEDNNLIEDKSLYPRLGYNMAYIYYIDEKYDSCLDLAHRIQYYLLANHLLYSKGELSHLTGIVYEKKNDLESASVYFSDAISVFSLENKNDFLIRSLRALAEIEQKRGNSIEATKLLDQAEEKIDRLGDHPAAEQMRTKIKHTRERCAGES
ncbi:helix-turn-helix transcriptional regulator [Rossellomorea marisflavi]|uniref:helix-turn-helix domain-containing protein n=1 Tax=Rossellomorea marisflavi TaxID=189381 RepID=UPI002041546B|nr:helix-turn-helix domain-containing protein [Rossellomorea marisflavi]MCM2603393.1 helix-turn-helix transcriptional regulator [Rossellomorea marisflavi]